MSGQEAIDKIGKYNCFGSILGLERMIEMLKRLGEPQKSLKVIHVAGTNGKGSVCRYIYEILRANGYKVGIYISPFLENFCERIEFDGEYISEEDLESYTNRVLEVAEAMVSEGLQSPTEFEIVTAIAMLYFYEKAPDFVILEVGLGGSGDSTNVIAKPLASVITSISFDHMDRLGDTIEEIAMEKAGIIKNGVPVIINVDKEEAAKVIGREAYKKGAVLHQMANTKVNRETPNVLGEIFTADIMGEMYSDVKISMVGEHQVENAITSLGLIEILRKNDIINISKQAIYEGINKARQKGRFEILEGEKGSPTYILDGAHNQEGVEALVKTVDDVFYGKKVLTIVGMLRDKDVDKMVDLLVHIGEDFIATCPNNPRRLEPSQLGDKFASREKRCKVAQTPEEALKIAKNHLDEYDIILCVGSLYLIGEIRRLIKNGTAQTKKGTAIL